jgi:hypothetical protein
VLQKRQAHHPRKLRLMRPTRPGFGRGQKIFSLCASLAAWVRAAMPFCNQNRPFESPSRPLNTKAARSAAFKISKIKS